LKTATLWMSMSAVLGAAVFAGQAPAPHAAPQPPSPNGSGAVAPGDVAPGAVAPGAVALGAAVPGTSATPRAAGPQAASGTRVDTSDDDFFEFLGADDVGDADWWEFLRKSGLSRDQSRTPPPQDAKQ
jgi:hypothetical protein